MKEKKMLTAILILTIFNTGLILIIGLGGIGFFKDFMLRSIKYMVDHTDSSIEAATTALFNADSLKQKAEMSGKAEL